MWRFCGLTYNPYFYFGNSNWCLYASLVADVGLQCNWRWEEKYCAILRLGKYSPISFMIFLSKMSVLDGSLLIFITEEYSMNNILSMHLLAGKLNRGLSVVDSYKLLQGAELTDDEFFLASALGWCIEWVRNRVPLPYFVKTEAFSRALNYISVSLLLHDNLCLLSMPLVASSIFPCAWWYYG